MLKNHHFTQTSTYHVVKIYEKCQIITQDPDTDWVQCSGSLLAVYMYSAVYRCAVAPGQWPSLNPVALQAIAYGEDSDWILWSNCQTVARQWGIPIMGLEPPYLMNHESDWTNSNCSVISIITQIKQSQVELAEMALSLGCLFVCHTFSKLANTDQSLTNNKLKFNST